MGGFIGGVVALLVGSGLATATVVGVVSAQTNSNEEPGEGTVQTQVLDYGTNQ